MSDLDQLAISRILGSTVRPFSAPEFGGFSTVKTIGEMLANRPTPSRPLAPDNIRDSAIIAAFEKTHEGYSVDRTLADPELTRRFIELCRELGVESAKVAICRRLLRLRKSGGFPVPTTREEKRDLQPFLIPAELAFAQLTYRYDASYDDLLADPEIGNTFDQIAARIGRSGDVVAYRLAGLHLRKNVRTRSKAEGGKLANFDIRRFAKRWRPLGTLSTVALEAVPATEGIFSLSEPNRHLYLTRYPNLRSAVGLFQDRDVLASVGNRFWSPSPEAISVKVVRREDVKGVSLRLFELKALETYQPLFNLLPKAA